MQRKSSSSVRVSYPRFDKEHLILALKEKLEHLALEFPLSSVILFGSYAKGNFTAGSDIDILVVYEGKKREDAFATVKQKIDITLLEPHVYSEEEYSKLRGTISKMTAGGILLFTKT